MEVPKYIQQVMKGADINVEVRLDNDGMYVGFGSASELEDIVLQKPINRFSYVPVSEEGLKEHILCYANELPDSGEEPDLYRGADIGSCLDNPDEIILNYGTTNESILLLTLKADEKFRAEEPELAAQEIVRIDF